MKITKSIPLVAVFAVSLLFLPLITKATSGACSYHSGVNCSAGSDYDGSVVCNDGWRDSSVLFSSMDECSSTPRSTCYPPYAVGCTTESAYTSMQSACGSRRAMDARAGLLGSSMDYSAQCQQELAVCSQQITKYSSDLSAYHACLSPTTNVASAAEVTDPNALCQLQFGSAAKPQPGKPGYCTCLDNFVFDENEQCVTGRSFCIKNMGEGAVYDSFSKVCACNTGYLLIDGLCIDQNKYCHNKFGIMSAYNANTKLCQCNLGYQLDQIQNVCVPKSIQLQPVAPPTVSVIQIQNTKGAADINTSTTKKTPPVTPPSKKFITTAKRINVRMASSAKAKIIGTTAPKTQYTLLNETDGWVKIQFGKKNGWVLKSLTYLIK